MKVRALFEDGYHWVDPDIVVVLGGPHQVKIYTSTRNQVAAVIDLTEGGNTVHDMADLVSDPEYRVIYPPEPEPEETHLEEEGEPGLPGRAISYNPHTRKFYIRDTHESLTPGERNE